jgi:predicted lactoylglutathione lyase
MTKELWINLPVKNVEKARNFFIEIGFKSDEKHETATSAAIMVGSKNIVVMLFEENQLQGFLQNELTDTTKSNEMMISFDAETTEEVDETAKKVATAGGNVFAPPANIQGWMYGFAFADLDDHRWNMLFMDMSKMKR